MFESKQYGYVIKPWLKYSDHRGCIEDDRRIQKINVKSYFCIYSFEIKIKVKKFPCYVKHVKTPLFFGVFESEQYGYVIKPRLKHSNHRGCIGDDRRGNRYGKK